MPVKSALYTVKYYVNHLILQLKRLRPKEMDNLTLATKLASGLG